MKHRCGGELLPQKVKIKKKVGYYYQTFTVDGYKCDHCGDEVISRDVAHEIDLVIEHLRNLWKDWRIPSTTKVTDVSKKDLLFQDNYIRI